MLANLTQLETITYRSALALQFIDVVTGQRVTDGLRVRCWGFDPSSPQLSYQSNEAEKSPNSGVYGFRSLPGLQRYEVGDTVPVGSLSFVALVEDSYGRFLPQTHRYDLPFSDPAVQLIPLYPSPNRPTPTGFGSIHVQLLQVTTPTGAPPEVTAVEPAAWARVSVSVPGNDLGDPPNVFHGVADGRGAALIQVPYPIIATSVLLTEAEWTVAVGVAYETAVLETDYTLLRQIIPNFDNTQTPPLQTTLEAQSAATLFATVTIVNATDQIYNIVGATNVTELDFTLQFGRPLTLRTQVDAAPDNPLSELLLESA